MAMPLRGFPRGAAECSDDRATRLKGNNVPGTRLPLARNS